VVHHASPLSRPRLIVPLEHARATTAAIPNTKQPTSRMAAWSVVMLRWIRQ